MGFLARKVTRAKWTAKRGLQAGELPADAVTADLRTQDNALSFWRCGDATVQGIRRAQLAVAAAAERLDKMDLAWVDKSTLEDDGVRFEKSPGRTPVAELVNEHEDAMHLDLVRLGAVAKRVAESITADRYQRLTRKEVLKLLRSAVDERLVAVESLSAGLQQEVLGA